MTWRLAMMVLYTCDSSPASSLSFPRRSMLNAHPRIPVGQGERYRQYPSQHLRISRSYHQRATGVISIQIARCEGLRCRTRGTSFARPLRYGS